MKKILNINLIIIIAISIIHITMSKLYPELYFQYIHLLSFLDIIPYFLLIIGFRNQDIYDFGKYFKWFIIAVSINAILMIFNILGVMEVDFGSMGYVYTFGAFSLYVVMPIYNEYYYIGNILYFLPLLLLTIPFISSSKYIFMKRASIVTILFFAISLLSAKLNLGISIYFNFMLIFIISVLIDIYRRPSKTIVAQQSKNNMDT